jgi:hypothetical protein
MHNEVVSLSFVDRSLEIRWVGNAVTSFGGYIKRWVKFRCGTQNICGGGLCWIVFDGVWAMGARDRSRTGDWYRKGREARGYHQEWWV